MARATVRVASRTRVISADDRCESKRKVHVFDILKQGFCGGDLTSVV